MVNELLSPRCPVVAILHAKKVKGVFGAILRDASIERSNPISSFNIVSHGVTIRCFRMQWMHYPVGMVRARENPRNCSVQLIEGRAGSGYSDRLVFDGFEHARESPQARREEGRVG